MQVQIQVLLGAAGEVGVKAATAGISRPNTGSNIKVAKPQTFNEEASKMTGFLMACRLYIRMRMREAAVKEQI